MDLIQYKEALFKLFKKLYIERDSDFKEKYQGNIQNNNLFKLILDKINNEISKTKENNMKEIPINGIRDKSTPDNNFHSININKINNDKKKDVMVKNNFNQFFDKNLNNGEEYFDDSFINRIKTIEKKTNKKEKKTNDKVFCEYLETCRLNTNSFSFEKILYFIILYRELVCVFKKDSFLENNRPGRLLEFSNLFFNYLYEVGIIEEIDDEEKIGIVENLIHLACWLSKNSYTCMKIYLGFLDVLEN